MSDLTPTYLAFCAECDGLIGASVADPQRPNSIGFAAKDYRVWQKAGYRMVIGTVQDVRTMGGRWGHLATCAKAKWPRQKQARLLPEEGSLEAL